MSSQPGTSGASAGGFQPPNLLYCKSCNVSVNSNAEWLAHLVGESHQLPKRIGCDLTLGMSEWDRNRTLSVNGIAGIPALKVADAINFWGPIEDISYLAKKDGGTHGCHFLMRTHDAVLSITRTTQPVKIGTRSLIVKQYNPSLRLLHGKALSLATLNNWEKNSKLSGGIQANGKFFCKGCSETIFPLAGWITHLTGEAHQSRHRECRFVRKMFWDLERTIRVGDMINVPARAVIDYLLEYGPIEDFFYLATKKQPTAPVCYCLFSCLASVEKVTANPKHAAYTKQGNHLSFTITPIHPDLKLRYKKMADMYTTQKHRGKSADALLTALKDEPDTGDLEEAIYSPGGILNSELVGGGTTYRNIPLGKLVTEPTRQRKHGFDCVTCDEEFQQTDEWWEHLASPAHRRVKNQLGGGLKYFKHTETVMLRGLLGISRMDILRFAGSWGPVQDLLYQSEKDGAGDSCYVRFESSETVDKILSCSSFLVIGSSQVVATPMPEYAGWSKKQRKALMAEKRALELANEVRAKLSSKSFREEGNEVVKLLEGKELLQQLDDLVQHASWDNTFWERCKEVVEEDIPFAIKKASFPVSPKLSSLIPFGQYVTGVALKRNLMVQLLLDVKVESAQEIVSILHNLRKILETCKPSANLCSARPTVDSIQNPEETSVNFGSELRFTNLAMKNEFVVRLGNRLGVQESNLISFYTKLDPRIQPALTIISYCSDIFKLMTPKEEAFPCQTISFMVLFFLIHQKIVPTVHHLTQKRNIKVAGLSKEDIDPIVEGYSVSFCNDLNVVKPNAAVIEMLSDPVIKAHSCLGLVKDILEFYGSVDLKKQVLCLRFGLLVPKVDFLPENVGRLPGELGRLYRFSSNGVHRPRFLNICSHLVLQDPFVLHLNLTNTIGGKHIKRFQLFCRHAAKRLEDQMIAELPNLGVLFHWQNNWNQNNTDTTIASLDDSQDYKDESGSPSSSKKIKLDEESCYTLNVHSESNESQTTNCATASTASENTEQKKEYSNEVTVKEENKGDPDVIEISDEEDDGWDKPESPSIFELEAEYEDVDDYEDNHKIGRHVDLTMPIKDLEGVDDFDDNISVISAEEEEVGVSSNEIDTAKTGGFGPIDDKFAEITVNRSLQVYFSRNFMGPNPDKIHRLQVLLLQYVIEFNSVFWTRCFNLGIEKKEDYADWKMPSFAVVDGLEGLHTLEERLASIDLSLSKVDLRFVVKSCLPMVHPFLENPNSEFISWKTINAGGTQDSTLGEITKLLIADHEDSASKLRASLFVPLTSKNYLELDGHLKANVVTNANSNISLGRCLITPALPQTGIRKVALLTKMWKKLQAKYCDRMVKRWLSSCKDFDRSKADNFQESVEKQRQKKMNKNQKKRQVFLNKKMKAVDNRRSKNPSAPQTNPNLVPIGPKKGILKKPAQSFPIQSGTYPSYRNPTPRQIRPFYRNTGPSMSINQSWRQPQTFAGGSVYGTSPPVHSGLPPSTYPPPSNFLQAQETTQYESYSAGFTNTNNQFPMQFSHRAPMSNQIQQLQRQPNPERFIRPQRFPCPNYPPAPDSERVPIYRRF